MGREKLRTRVRFFSFRILWPISYIACNRGKKMYYSPLSLYIYIKRERVTGGLFPPDFGCRTSFIFMRTAVAIPYSSRKCFFPLSILYIRRRPPHFCGSSIKSYCVLVTLLCWLKANRAKKRIALYIDRSLRSDKGDWMGLEVALCSCSRGKKKREKESRVVVYFSSGRRARCIGGLSSLRPASGGKRR